MQKNLLHIKKGTLNGFLFTKDPYNGYFIFWSLSFLPLS